MTEKKGYTGWKVLPECDKSDGHHCREWLPEDGPIDSIWATAPTEDELFNELFEDAVEDFLFPEKDEKLVVKAYTEVAIPEAAPITKDYQRFMIIGSTDSEGIVEIFFNGNQIRVNSGHILYALQRVV